MKDGGAVHFCLGAGLLGKLEGGRPFEVNQADGVRREGHFMERKQR